jgi:hypothetical protein
MTNDSPPHGQLATGSSVQWLTDFDNAIQACDELSLWQLLARHGNQREAYRHFATQVARLAYLVRGRPRFSEMFLVPVIDSASARVMDNDAVWKPASRCIGEALDSWLAPKLRKTVFAGIRPYDWVGTWRPAILRDHLHSTVPGARIGQVTFLTEAIDLPEEAPRLGFICMVLTGERGWPELPQAGTLRDNRFKAVVGMALQPTAEADAPTVLAPDRLQFAVTDGLCLWLHILHQAVPILGWTVTPLAASPDVLRITLAWDRESVRYTQFTLRKHQIGLDGVQGVLTMLQSLAPTMDAPMDLPQRHQNARTVPLT